MVHAMQSDQFTRVLCVYMRDADIKNRTEMSGLCAFDEAAQMRRCAAMQAVARVDAYACYATRVQGANATTSRCADAATYFDALLCLYAMPTTH